MVLSWQSNNLFNYVVKNYSIINFILVYLICLFLLHIIIMYYNKLTVFYESVKYIRQFLYYAFFVSYIYFRWKMCFLDKLCIVRLLGSRIFTQRIIISNNPDRITDIVKQKRNSPCF